ncbi:MULTISPECIES: DNA-processing protein DprA [Planococcus]|uniref:DNA protecting protein DprA n=1 Tax=Planococcus faecalis TaxID=1598147 RepID=A0ABM6ITA2_9BACL|nr:MULTISPECIES: DNA-processing protein DprA [Planococcus]AQU79827.1 DNA protecting protein DprA [Planococcus faecalis]MDJ0330812.1 DNA-processing protein DprA [Planococcus sp. S3-L1]OHX53506.1 DNA protecting protein DprA [Planococcus faecalis]
MNKEFTERLLALHYVYPKSLNKLLPLLADDPDLSALEQKSPNELMSLLNIKLEQAIKLKASYRQSLTYPLREAYDKYKILPMSYQHPFYPESLFELIDPPAVIYAKGDLTLLANPQKIAIIGSRKATSYSQKALHTIIPPLVENNFIIVSGLARGADAMAHQKTIDLGGRTIAVTGSGFLHPYPKENNALNDIIEEKQLVLTEYPPYMKPLKWNFPMRNRIISGLSKGIVVTEALVKSGTLSTIEHALDHGKDIFAVPGDIGSLLSEGPHKLILEGAKPVWNGWQVLEEYQQMTAEKQ